MQESQTGQAGRHVGIHNSELHHAYSDTTPTPRLIFCTRHPIIMQSIHILDLELTKIDTLLRLIDRQQVDRENLVFLSHILVIALSNNLHTAFVTEI